MRSLQTVCLSLVLFLSSALAAAAQPASATPAEPESGYIEGVAQSAFGHITSQSYGAEAAYMVRSQVEAFLEFGRIADQTTDGMQASAATIAPALTAQGISISVREPVTFVDVGGKFLIATSGGVHPYVLAGGGIALVKHDAKFQLGTTDVTGTLTQYGVTLGSDLSGTTTSGVVVGGVGAMIPIGRILVLDLQVRINHVFSDPSISTGRAGIGFGLRF